MHQAAHWQTKIGNGLICSAPYPCAPGNLGTQNISSFERIRAIQNLDTGNDGLILQLSLPNESDTTPNISNYLATLKNEAQLVFRHLRGTPLLQQLHLHGDTTGYTAAQLHGLLQFCRQFFQVPPSNFAWFSIRPSSNHLGWSELGKLRDAGFNRIVLECTYSSRQTLQSLYEAARALRYNTISMALTLSSPIEPKLRQLEHIAQQQPDRILLEPHTGQNCCQHYPETILALEKAGYLPTTHCCFVLPDDELTEPAGNRPNGQPVVVGLGCGAHSRIHSLTYYNDSRLDSYIKNIDAHQLPYATGCRQPILP